MSAIQTAIVRDLPIGAKGFDMNAPLSLALARAFVAKGFTFACRYIWRDHFRNGDLTAPEIESILLAGLGLVIVQHAPLPGWAPSAANGAQMANAVIDASKALDLPKDMTFMWDLEGVAAGTLPSDVVGCATAFSFGLSGVGFTSRACYVGDACGLGPKGLGALPFNLFAQAYNTSDDLSPVPRGFCLKQRAPMVSELPAGLTVESIDVLTVTGDSMGGLPRALFASEAP